MILNHTIFNHQQNCFLLSAVLHVILDFTWTINQHKVESVAVLCRLLFCDEWSMCMNALLFSCYFPKILCVFLPSWQPCINVREFIRGPFSNRFCLISDLPIFWTRRVRSPSVRTIRVCVLCLSQASVFVCVCSYLNWCVVFCIHSRQTVCANVVLNSVSVLQPFVWRQWQFAMVGSTDVDAIVVVGATLYTRWTHSFRFQFQSVPIPIGGSKLPSGVVVDCFLLS